MNRAPSPARRQYFANLLPPASRDRGPVACLKVEMDDPYFERGLSWADRLARCCEDGSPFDAANRQVVARCIGGDQLRVVINMPPEALLSVLGGDHYRNCYELPFVAGAVRGPSPKRIAVDALLGFVPDGSNRYFAAICLGGAGVHFYGEYCIVLLPSAAGQPALLDRNSYELLDPPLSDDQNKLDLVQTLRASWPDLPNVLTLKVLFSVRHPNRLLPPGVVAETVMRDEDFVEAHLDFQITRDSIEEIRQPPEEAAREAHVRQQMVRGQIPRPEEQRWTSRRRDVDVVAGALGVRNRIVTTSGRGARWK